MAEKSIIDRLIDIRDHLPKKQRTICQDIIEHYREVNVLTIQELAKRNQVGTTTVIRFVQAAGFKSFQEFKKNLQEYTLASSVDKWSYVKNAFTNDMHGDHVLPNSVQELVKALNATLTKENLRNLNEAAGILLEAKKIHVLGVRVSKSAALYFDMILTSFAPKVNQLSYDNEFIFDRILQFEEGDVMVVFATSIMTARTIEAVKMCKEQGHKVIIITDLDPCPGSSYATVLLQAAPSKNRFSVIPMLAIAEALIIEMGVQMSGESINNLEKAGNLLRDKNKSL